MIAIVIFCAKSLCYAGVRAGIVVISWLALVKVIVNKGYDSVLSTLFLSFLKTTEGLFTKSQAYNIASAEQIETIKYIKDQYIEILDNLSLMQEAALFNILVLVLILIIILDIIIILFRREIINYFNLEVKYPRFKKILDINSKYQNYTLIFKILSLIPIFCVSLYINILTLLYT